MKFNRELLSAPPLCTIHEWCNRIAEAKRLTLNVIGIAPLNTVQQLIDALESWNVEYDPTMSRHAPARF